MDDSWNAQRPLYEVKANLFKGLSHPVRVRVLEVLSSRPETSVAELLTDTGLEASHLSQHLSVLRKHHLVAAERRGSLVYYRIAHAQVADLLRVARILLTEVLHATQAQLSEATGMPPLPDSSDH